MINHAILLVLAIACSSLAAAADLCSFESSPQVISERGPAYAAGSEVFQLWEVSDQPVLWSTTPPPGGSYAAYSEKLAATKISLDPRDLLKRTDLPDRSAVELATELTHPITCLEMLLVGTQHARLDLLDEPTEFAAFILRSFDRAKLRIYYYTKNVDGIGRVSFLEPIERDRAAGWEVSIALHNHTVQPAHQHLNAALGPSLPDAQLNQSLRKRIGLKAAWITNGVNTVRVPASQFDRFAKLLEHAPVNVQQLNRPLSRRYTEGGQLTYLMKGANDGWTYQVRITSVTRKHPDGHLFEEYAWSGLLSDGKPRTLTPDQQALRLAIRHAKGVPPFTPPDLSKVGPLIGPVLDLVTFHADLFLAMHEGNLLKAGDSFRFPGVVASWADGHRVVLGEDHVDFDIELIGVDHHKGLATILIKHIPPEVPKVKLPAEWMRTPVSDTPNNYVQVRKSGPTYLASIGKETFDVELKVRIGDGVIQSAAMHNPVEKFERRCTDAALTQCDEPQRKPTLRRIHLSLEP